MNAPAATPRLRRWQGLTVALLVVGYAGYYLCRSNFSVALPLILDDLEATGLDRADAVQRMGLVASIGVLAYAGGKFGSGALADFFGGRLNFLAGMLGSVGFTLLFAAGGSVPFFTLAWAGNRLVQSMGWVGMVKITSRWFSFSRYGTVMGIISLSFLFGDAAARRFMAALIGAGLGWSQVFVVTAACLAILLGMSALLLRESPGALGEAEPEAAPGNLFGVDGQDPRPAGLRALLGPLLRSPAFGLVCALSLGCTLLRESFNTWIPTYFTDAVGLSQADAAAQSAWFPFFGGVSVLVAGYASDRLGRGGRALVITGGLAAAAVALGLLGGLGAAATPTAAVALVAAVGFLLIGPYSYLAGAIALDFGGKRGSATACGIIDGVGYLGGVLAGGGVARLSATLGWSGAFTGLALVAAASSAAGAVFLWDQRRVPARAATS